MPPTETYAENGKVFGIRLSDEDLNAIKADYGLASDRDNTYLTLEFDAIQDMNQNSIEAITSPQMGADFEYDITSPDLTDAKFDFNEGILNLTFSETVNVKFPVNRSDVAE